VQFQRDLQFPVPLGMTAAGADSDPFDRHRVVVRHAPPTPHRSLIPGAEVLGQDLVLLAIIGLEGARDPRPGFVCVDPLYVRFLR
jgi:hypothetical protein